jgi:hypothetical protein
MKRNQVARRQTPFAEIGVIKVPESAPEGSEPSFAP